jgi:hypothetical protein
MADRRASILGGRSSHSDRWELMHNWKSRKKKTKSRLIKPNKTTPNYQQLNLRGENIDAADGEAFGNPRGKNLPIL